MYPYAHPYTITNPFGEELTFEGIQSQDGKQFMMVTNRVAPQSGPPFHVHFKQDESLKVTEGRMGYQIKGEPEKFLEPGESVVFERGQMHRFWNAGPSELLCTGWLSPPNTTDYFLDKVYASATKANKPEGDAFESAFLLTRYKSEYAIDAVPPFVMKVIMPVTVFFGRLLGKYRKFSDAPAPLR